MTRYKILFAEDVPEDMELAELELRKAGIEFDSIRVDNRKDFIENLINFKPDVVISDYSMPSFTGMDALKIVLEYSPYTPVIIHTGSINEETAVKCMKSGAFDYILKEKILRLPFAIKEAYDKSRILKQNREAQNALKLSEERYKRLFNSITQGVFYVHGDGRISMINPSAMNIYGLSDEHISIEDFLAEWQFFYDDGTTVDLWKYASRNSYDSSKPVDHIVIQATHKESGAQKFLSINIIPELDNENEQFRALVVTEDITYRKMFERDLIQAKTHAEESDKLKTSFLANLSHEVRTPMNAILGFSQLLSDLDKADEDEKFFIHTIQENSVKLLGIITDIIEISKIETEEITISRNEFDLESLQHNINDYYKNSAEAKGLNLLTIGFDNNIILYSDEQKIVKVISCLIDNAIKFTEEGVIRVTCMMKPDAIEVHVVDTGVGIPPQNEKIIFERFRQGDEGYNRKHGGTGLGLSISKAYVEALGGHLFYKPAGKGSDFGFYIPLKWRQVYINNPFISDNQNNPDYSSQTFLIAEDDPTNFAYIVRLLAPTSVNIIAASDGEDAVLKFNENPNIDLVLMDIKMPFMNGYEATAKIRESNESVPIIATTAYAMSGDKERCLQSGFSGYISKPINRVELFDIISKFLSINHL
jgi:PAS domain S-box-containing protein